MANKLEKLIDEFSKKYDFPFEKWNNQRHKCLIAITRPENGSYSVQSFIKSLEYNFGSHEVKIEKTYDVYEAMHFDNHICNMLYHYGKYLNLKHISIYPFDINKFNKAHCRHIKVHIEKHDEDEKYDLLICAYCNYNNPRYRFNNDKNNG